jgi:hypothetical protein
VFTNRFDTSRSAVDQRDATPGFGAVELGLQTMLQLARHLGVA